MTGLRMKRIDFLLKSSIIFEKIINFFKFVLVKSFVGVFLNLNNWVSYYFVTLLLVEEFFDGRIDFMGSFPPFNDFEYILVAINYVSKWIEAIATWTNDHKVVIKFVQRNNFSRFGFLHAIISDGGTHFTNYYFRTLLWKYGITHKIATPYHPQTSG